MIEAAINGFLTGFSLILAIGAQNAFVLRQGLRREHVGLVVLLCAASDAVLMALGVAGFGLIERAAPLVIPALRWAGVAFLLVYGALRFRAAFRGGESLAPAPGGGLSARAAAGTTLLLTWANPHVYLDTVVLVGSISTHWAVQGGEPARFGFGAGAALSSAVFFVLLGFGARALAPLFARPRAWVVLELAVGATMWLVAAGLILGGSPGQ